MSMETYEKENEMAIQKAIRHYENKMKTIVLPTDTLDDFLVLSGEYEREARRILLKRSTGTDFHQSIQTLEENILRTKREFSIANKFQQISSTPIEKSLTDEAFQGDIKAIENKHNMEKGKGLMDEKEDLSYISKVLSETGDCLSMDEGPTTYEKIAGLTRNLKRLLFQQVSIKQETSPTTPIVMNYGCLPTQGNQESSIVDVSEEPICCGICCDTSSIEQSELPDSLAASPPRAPLRQWACRCCNEFHDYDGIVVSPSCLGNTYRLDLQSAGLYFCQKTRIKFQVKCPMTIHYEVASWRDHLQNNPHMMGHEVIGPLFNITPSEGAHMVSAVYLPHYLCLQRFTGDREQIKCAHFKDGNITLESPSRIDPFYVVLENPDFSCLGPFLFRSRGIQIHGIVLIYFQVLCADDPTKIEHRINLYLLPDSVQEEEALDQRKQRFGFRRIEKPAQTTESVYVKKKKYLVTGPSEASVRPKVLPFQSRSPLNHNEFTEVSLKGEAKDIHLYVSEESTKDTVWDAVISTGDIDQLMMKSRVPECTSLPHFVDRYRSALIVRMNAIEPVLDELLDKELLTQEQYDNIRLIRTDQGKMRELYTNMRGWSDPDKDVFYQALRRRNKSLILELERTKSH